MACPSCSFARTFARRTAVSSLATQRTFATTPAALQKAEAPSTPTQHSATAPLLHITKTKAGRGPSNPNARPPPPSHSSITRLLGVRFSRPVPGAQEWRTSSYSYNKATVKTLPTAAQKTNELLTHYSTLIDNGGVPSSRSAIATRRKSAEKMYTSKVGVKDFGDKIRIDAYMFDEKAAFLAMMRKKSEAKDARKGKKSAKPAAKSRAPRGQAPRPQ
ncbi:hypothetical protein Q7P37_000454 [Cladosporium fusiforme]